MKGVKLSRRNEYNIARRKADGFPVGPYRIAIFYWHNEFQSGVPVKREIFRIRIHESLDAFHVPVSHCLMCAVKYFNHYLYLLSRCCQFVKISRVVSGYLLYFPQSCSRKPALRKNGDNSDNSIAFERKNVTMNIQWGADKKVCKSSQIFFSIYA